MHLEQTSLQIEVNNWISIEHVGNFRAHYLHTAVEILEQSGGKIDAFVDFVGSGGTFSGCARRFKEHSSDIKCFIVEPEGAGIHNAKQTHTIAILSGEKVTHPNHKIQGGGYSKDSNNLPLLIEPNDISGFKKAPFISN